ncbi:PAS domain-containing protein [Mucilaginibacter sp.]
MLESVNANITDGVMITSLDIIPDRGPVVIYINEAFSRMTGYASAEMIGEGPEILYGSKTYKNK